MKNRWKVVAAFAAAVALVAAPLSSASATEGGYPPEVCIPSDAIPAWTEVVPDIVHPAVYETVVVTPTIPAIAAVWLNFSPNNDEGTFIGPPAFPVDERGTWHDHGILPPGQAGPDGVYANGNPDKGGNWFYRHAAVPAVPEVTKDVLVEDEWTEVVPDIEHAAVPAVVCPPDEEEPEVLTEWHTWKAPEWVPGLEEGGATDVGWPQSYVGPGQIEPTDCEVTYQQDKYVGTREQIDAVLDDDRLDGPASNPEDAGLAKEWHFSSTAECPDEDFPLPALFAADPLPPTCEADGGLPTVEELQALYPNVAVSFDREFDGPGDYTLTVTPDEGYAFVPANVVAPWSLNEDGSASRVVTVTGALGYQDDDPQAECYVEPQVDPTEVALTLPVVNDVCGAGDYVLLPDDAEGVDYSWASEDAGNYDVIATVADGFVATNTEGWTDNEDGTFTRVITLTNEACPTDPDEPTDPSDPSDPDEPTDDALAATGGSNLAPWGLGGLALLLAGISAMAFRKVAAR
jgi:hypothetical protein